jgi:ATP-dependent Lon protease
VKPGTKNVALIWWESSSRSSRGTPVSGGVWCICDIEYFHTDDQRVVPWILGSINPIQLSKFDVEQYLEACRGFTTDEWIDLLMRSIGFNPELFSRRGKFFQLVRLIQFVERNYNLIELGPKGTRKSHIFSEFSPTGCSSPAARSPSPSSSSTTPTGASA